MDVKKNRHKKHKKEKKARLEKKRCDSEDESSSDEAEWIEAASSYSSSKQKREEWMDDDSYVPTYDKGDLPRKSRKKQELEEIAAREKKILEERELNPHWKNKGKGVPDCASEEEESSMKLPSHSVGDGGYSWLKKAYDRVKEKAAEEGRTMEDVAQERWGSLQKLETMLRQAESRKLRRQDSDPVNRSPKNSKYEYVRGMRNDDEHYRKKSECYSSYDREHDAYRHHRRERQEDYCNSKERGSKKNDYEQKDSHHSSKSEKSSYKSSRFMAPRDDFEDSRKRDSQKSSISSKHVPSWKKKSLSKEFIPPQDSSDVQNSLYDEKKNEKFEAKHTENIDRTTEKEESHPSIKQDSNEDEDSEDKKKNCQHMIENVILNQNEMNYFGARLLRAKLEGDKALATQIQKDFCVVKEKRNEFVQSGGKIVEDAPRDDVIDYLIDFYPLPKQLKANFLKRRKPNSRDVYVGPLKRKSFNEDRSSLQNIYENERMSTIDDQMKMYFTAATSCQDSINEECDADVSGNIEKKMNSYPSHERDVQKAIQDHKKLSAALKKCRFCWDQPALLKHTVIAKGEHVFLSVPSCRSLVEGHCYVVPIRHVPSILHLDENEYEEVQGYKRALAKMASDKDQCTIFMETSFHHKFHPHATIECIPIPRETGEMAPLYFKKAIDESEHEWSQNKKLIDLSKKGIRHSVPKGLPYFSVEFGFKGGFAHIIEDERQFPNYFGKEIIGGMMEIDSHNIVKQKEESTIDICRKTLKLVTVWWKKYKNYV